MPELILKMWCIVFVNHEVRGWRDEYAALPWVVRWTIVHKVMVDIPLRVKTIVAEVHNDYLNELAFGDPDEMEGSNEDNQRPSLREITDEILS